MHAGGRAVWAPPRKDARARPVRLKCSLGTRDAVTECAIKWYAALIASPASATAINCRRSPGASRVYYCVCCACAFLVAPEGLAALNAPRPKKDCRSVVCSKRRFSMHFRGTLAPQSRKDPSLRDDAATLLRVLLVTTFW